MCDVGVDSLLAQKLGMKKEIEPNQVAVGCKEVFKLSEEIINERFGVASGEGAALLCAGDPTDGYHRDTPMVLEQNFPVFSNGCYGPDSGVRTQVVDFRCQIEIGEVTINDGDYLF